MLILCCNAASVFGEQWRLEPMSAERKARWRKEIDWLLCVTDYVVEFVPSQQKSKDGGNMEVRIVTLSLSLSLDLSHKIINTSNYIIYVYMI